MNEVKNTEDNWPALLDKRPRLLYVGFDVGFLDPTRELMVEVFKMIGDLVCFGPGYQDLSTVMQGINAFVERTGPYDILIGDERLIDDYQSVLEGKTIQFKSHACSFDPKLLRLGLDYQKFMKSYTGLRVLCLMQSDYYNWSTARIELIESVADFYVTWGEEFITPVSDFRHVDTIAGAVNAHIKMVANDNYLDFLARHREKIISCPQFVSAAEICDLPIKERTYDWSLLGADYDGRIIARNLIDETGINRTGNWLRVSQNLITKLGFNIYNKYWTQGVMHWGFRRALRQSKYSFTCGSILRWPIRKYFELPVNGCVSVCEPTAGFESLGFRDKKNVLECEAQDILDADSWLRAHPIEAQAIADAGRDHVLAAHSVNARARQIAHAFQAILDRAFSGSAWVDGEFTLTEAGRENGPDMLGRANGVCFEPND